MFSFFPFTMFLLFLHSVFIWGHWNFPIIISFITPFLFFCLYSIWQQKFLVCHRFRIRLRLLVCPYISVQLGFYSQYVCVFRLWLHIWLNITWLFGSPLFAWKVIAFDSIYQDWWIWQTSTWLRTVYAYRHNQYTNVLPSEWMPIWDFSFHSRCKSILCKTLHCFCLWILVPWTLHPWLLLKQSN